MGTHRFTLRVYGRARVFSVVLFLQRENMKNVCTFAGYSDALRYARDEKENENPQ
jgi:hypothetical protein